MKKFSEIIREERKARNMTQEALAEELGVSKSTVAMWEAGERYPIKESYQQIADLFNLDIDYLYERTDIKKKHHFTEQGDEYINADYLSETSCEEIVQNLFDDDMKLLFNLKKSTQADRLMEYARFLKEKYDKDNNL